MITISIPESNIFEKNSAIMKKIGRIGILPLAKATGAFYLDNYNGRGETASCWLKNQSGKNATHLLYSNRSQS